MADPTLADQKPAVLELEAGKKYAWCSCGNSKNQPFCDGSHQGSEFRPIVFQLDEPKRVALCQCKRTAGAPYCDGTHAKL